MDYVSKHLLGSPEEVTIGFHLCLSIGWFNWRTGKEKKIEHGWNQIRGGARGQDIFPLFFSANI